MVGGASPALLRTEPGSAGGREMVRTAHRRGSRYAGSCLTISLADWTSRDLFGSLSAAAVSCLWLWYGRALAATRGRRFATE
jgi:hypothetical protein